MDKEDLLISNSVIRIVGVFELESSLKSSIGKFLKNDFVNQKKEVNKSQNHLKNYWYPEFRDMYFLNREESASTILIKSVNENVDFVLREANHENERKLFKGEIISVEIFLFNKHLNFFSIEVNSSDKRLSSVSDLTFCVRNFDTIVETTTTDIKWVNWIEQNILGGILISSNESKPKVKVDDYSGSKFKLFTILNLKEHLDKKLRLELLYDIGSVAKIGSAGGNYSFTPSEDYFNELMLNSISVFNNYDILPMFDSLTVIGNELLDEDINNFKNTTWSKYYFRIYIHNLFIKFNLFRYNSEMIENSVEVRNQFESFLNIYNLQHISYNFLPNLINQKLRSSLDIDNELVVFQERINRISQSISEKKQNRGNLLLGLLGIMTSLSSISPVIDMMESLQFQLGWSSFVFYTTLSLAIILLAVPLLIYLFPDKLKQVKRRLRKD